MYLYICLRVGENVLNHSGFVSTINYNLSLSIFMYFNLHYSISNFLNIFQLFPFFIPFRLDNTIVNIIFLKFLPLRASIKHHDSHHKFSNYPGGKNFLSFFKLKWNYLRFLILRHIKNIYNSNNKNDYDNNNNNNKLFNDYVNIYRCQELWRDVLALGLCLWNIQKD